MRFWKIRRFCALLLLVFALALLALPFVRGSGFRAKAKENPGDLSAVVGGSDINLITGSETFPRVTQGSSVVWSHESTIVVLYDDSSGSAGTPPSGCGVSVSGDGGATFTRLPEKFNNGGTCYGAPAIVYSRRAQKWYASFLTARCGVSGMGQWTSPDGVTWSNAGCVFSGNLGAPSRWVDNNPASPYYGRLSVLFNDFDSFGDVRSTISDNDGVTWAAVRTLSSSNPFRRAIGIVGSLSPDGVVVAEMLDEGGGGVPALRRNFFVRSTDGGTTWSAPVQQGPAFAAPGRAVCSDDSYFACMYANPGYWREMGGGQLTSGPNGVFHYVFTDGNSDVGRILHTRSIDKGLTWSAFVQLNSQANNLRAQWRPSIAANSFGEVFVSWYDERNDTQTNLQRYGVVSHDNGETFENEIAVSDVLFPKPAQPDPFFPPSYVGYYERAAFSEDGYGRSACVTWIDGRNSINGSPQQDVFFDKLDFSKPSLVVTTLNDHDDGACDPADCTLREAINSANANIDFDTISFASGLAGTIQLASALPAISAFATIEGPGANVLTVRRNVASEFRIFAIEQAVVSISGLTMSDGRLTPSGSTGAGIYNNGGSLTLTNCALTGHVGYAAGALYNSGGTANVSNCTFSGNSAFEGGAIDNAAISNTATLSVKNSTFSGNSASSNGGAISNGSLAGNATSTLTNCTFSDNSSPTGGAVNNGAFFGGTATTTVRNSIFKTGASGANLANNSGAVISQGHNLSNDNGAGFLNASGDQINTNPQIGALQSNGGQTSTHALLSASPAINAGDNAFAPATDQRGHLRNGGSDIGAFEFNGISLRIISVTRSGSDIVVTFDAAAQRTFRLERRSDLASGVWGQIIGVSDLTPIVNGPAQIVDPGAATLGRRFYRVRTVP